MTTYPATLDDLHLMAELACQLDYVKNLLPPECAPSFMECQRLQQAGHATVQRLLGTDASAIYGSDNPEEEAA